MASLDAFEALALQSNVCPILYDHFDVGYAMTPVESECDWDDEKYLENLHRAYAMTLWLASRLLEKLQKPTKRKPVRMPLREFLLSA